MSDLPEHDESLAQRPGEGMPHPYRIMIGLYLAAFVGMFGETAMNIAMPQLSAAFDVPVSMMQWMVIGHMLVIGLVMPFASLLMKKYPVRRLVLFSIGCFCAGCLISGFAVSFPMLIAGRMVQGLGPGIILPVMFAMVVRVFPARRIGTAMGFCSLIIMFAPAVGPTLAGLIMGALSWRWVFFLFAAILVVAFALAARFLVSPYELTNPKIDGMSCLLSVIGFSCLILGVGLASLLGWGSPVTLALLVVGIVGIVLYVRRQMRMEVPVLNMRCFGIPGFRSGTVLVMLVFGVNLSAMFLLPQFFQNGIGLSVAAAGVALLPGGIVNCIVSLVSGKLYDRIGPRIPVVVGLCTIALGGILVLLATSASAVWYVILCHVVILVGVPLAMSPSQSTALGSLPQALSTDGSAILNTLQQVWGAVCTAVATSLLGIGQHAYAGADAAGAFTNGVHFGMAFILLLVVIGLIVAFRLKKPSKAEA